MSLYSGVPGHTDLVKSIPGLAWSRLGKRQKCRFLLISRDNFQRTFPECTLNRLIDQFYGESYEICVYSIDSLSSQFQFACQ